MIKFARMTEVSFVRTIGYSLVVSVLCSKQCWFDSETCFNNEWWSGKIAFLFWLVFYTGYLSDELLYKSRNLRGKENIFDIIGWMFFLSQAMFMDVIAFSAALGSIGICIVTWGILSTLMCNSQCSLFSRKIRLCWVGENAIAIVVGLVVSFSQSLAGLYAIPLLVVVWEKFVYRMVKCRKISPVTIANYELRFLELLRIVINKGEQILLKRFEKEGN